MDAEDTQISMRHSISRAEILDMLNVISQQKDECVETRADDGVCVRSVYDEVVRKITGLVCENTLFVRGVVECLMNTANLKEQCIEEDELLEMSGTDANNIPLIPLVDCVNQHQEASSATASRVYAMHLLGINDTEDAQGRIGKWPALKNLDNDCGGGDELSLKHVDVFDGKKIDENLQKALQIGKSLLEIQKQEQDALFVRIGTNKALFLKACYDLRVMLPGQLSRVWNVTFPTHITMAKALREVLKSSSKYGAPWLPCKLTLIDDMHSSSDENIQHGKVDPTFVTRSLVSNTVYVNARGFAAHAMASLVALTQTPRSLKGTVIPVVDFLRKFSTSSTRKKAHSLGNIIQLVQKTPGDAYSTMGVVRPEVLYAEHVHTQYMTRRNTAACVPRWQSNFAKELRRSKGNLNNLPRWRILAERGRNMRELKKETLDNSVYAKKENSDVFTTERSHVCVPKSPVPLIEVINDEHALCDISPDEIVQRTPAEPKKIMHFAREVVDECTGSVGEESEPNVCGGGTDVCVEDDNPIGMQPVDVHYTRSFLDEARDQIMFASSTPATQVRRSACVRDDDEY